MTTSNRIYLQAEATPPQTEEEDAKKKEEESIDAPPASDDASSDDNDAPFGTDDDDEEADAACKKEEACAEEGGTDASADDEENTKKDAETSMGAKAAFSKFSVVAYTGAPIDVGFGSPVVVNLSGVKTRSDKLPIFYGHDSEKGVGHAVEIKNDGDKLILQCVVSRDTREAREFVESSKRGYPWQASIGGAVLERQELSENERTVVNGREIVGPAIIAQALELYEVSVCEIGADSHTSATLTARFNLTNGNEENMTTRKTNLEVQKQRDEIAAELDRVAEIKARASNYSSAPNVEKLTAEAVRSGQTPDAFELTVLRACRASVPVPNCSRESSTVDTGALVAAALRAGGIAPRENVFSEKQLESADKLRGCGLQEFMEIAAGQPLPRFRSDGAGFLRAAFSQTNLSNVLSRAVNAVLLESFNYVESMWQDVFKQGRVVDFKIAERYRMNSDMQFEQVAKGGKLPHGSVSDEMYSVKADTYGVMFAIDRQDIINDDLGALSDIPRQIGVSAAEAINNACWGMFLNPGNADDGTAFYSAGHNSLLTTCPLTDANLTKARAAFVKKTKKNGAPIGLRPTLLVVPPELEDDALRLTRSTMLAPGGEGTFTDFNVQHGRYKVVAPSYLSSPSMTGNSATSWYLMADPRVLAAFEIAFLDGKSAPTVERADADFDSLGVQFKGYIDFGVSLQDWRAIVKATA